MKRDKIIYWIVTGLLSAMMLLQAFMFTFNSEQMGQLFTSLGIPAALVIPMGIAKFLAIVAILTKKSDLLKKLAYYGLAIDFSAAIVSHLMAGDGDWPSPLVAMVLLGVSFVYDRKLYQTANDSPQ